MPLADAEVVEVLRPAQLAELVGRPAALLGAQVVPQGDDRQEVGAGDVEAPVGGIGLGALVGRTLARILDRQGGGDDENLADATVAVGFEHHAAEAGVDGQTGEAFPDRRQRSDAGGVRRVDRRQFLEQQVAVAHRRRVGGSTNGKAATSPSPNAVICKMTDARLVRRISGSVNSGRAT